MNKNQIWKLLFIVALVLIAIMQVTPLDKKLKSGLDIGGGVSLIYDIDVEGLTNKETKGLARRMIPILSRRIDPTNVANIKMIPHGDTRIEIQLPLASADTMEKRNVYQDKMAALESENINLLKIRGTLSKKDINIEEAIAKFAGDSEKRTEILTKWAKISTERSALQSQRTELEKKMESLISQLKEANMASVERLAPTWNKLNDTDMAKAIADNAKDDAENILLTNNYMMIFKEIAPIVNKLTKAETGLHTQYRTASSELAQLNLSQGLIMDTLALGDTDNRADKIDDIIVVVPSR
jgi:preprotein translocase subunit SecD